jgi:hypothetical protein
VTTPNPNQLVVEDEDLKGVVIGVMRHYLGGWSRTPAEWPVEINVGNSADEILRDAELITRMQASGVKTIGVIVDAETSLVGRWQRIRNFCLSHGGGNIPDVFPLEGLISNQIHGRRFGAWIMPNNTDDGMLENFCRDLVPQTSVWHYATSSADNAKKLGASYSDAHKHKAHIHTWLAWQDPPGERMGSAITKKILSPEKGQAKLFADWFRKLYGV